MKIVEVNGEKGNEVLQTAHKLNITFYDAAYLIEAKKSSITLVSDDIKLAKAAESLDVKTLSSKAFLQS